jgi:hypothetical protein
MGWKYEVEIYLYEDNTGWKQDYYGNSLLKAVAAIRKLRKAEPGRAYRLTIR